MRRWTTSTVDGREQKQRSLPTTSNCLALHPGGRHRLRGTRHVYASSARVDDGDGITNPSRCWLMQLQSRWLALV